MKTLKFLILILALIMPALILLEPAKAQVNQLWASTYDGTGNGQDEVSAMTVDASGNVYVTGRSRSDGFLNNFDFLTIKYNSSGDTLWVERFDGNGLSIPTDEAKDIAVDGLGFVYVTGSSVASDQTSDFLTIKYDSNGDTVWVRRYSYASGSNDDAYSLAIDEMGYVYVTGRTNGDYLTIAYDASGVFQWSEKYNGTGNDQDIATKILYRSGALYVTGRSRSSSSSLSADFLTIKYNLSGDSLWVRRYNGPADNFDEPSSMFVDLQGNVYITGSSQNASTSASSDYVTIKYNSSGDSVWVRRYNGDVSGQDNANDIVVDDSGNVYVTGTSAGTFLDIVTIKYNSSGVQQWVERYHGPFNTSNDYGYSISLGTGGFIYVSGGSNESSIGTTDIITLKYNASGDQQWKKTFNGGGNSGDMAYLNYIDDSENIYVCGNSTEGTLDYVTIKYEKSTGINITSNNIPGQFILYQNFPNPFNPSTKIRFDLPESGIVKLKIFDILGKETAVLVNGKLNAGVYEYEWDASSYTSGIYFYTLQTESHRETKKLVLSK